MRIDKLRISEFKNLRNFEIDFDENELISVIVGRNGAGKSNVLEALVIIFRDLDLGEPPQFAYELIYRIGNYTIWVDANPTRSKNYTIKVKPDKREFEVISIAQFSSEKNRHLYLPKYVFGYYSGPSNRLETHFQKHQDIFYRQLINRQQSDNSLPLRPLFYARLIHSQFALLAFFLEDDANVKQFLQDQLRIVGLDSVLFILKTPNWANQKRQKSHFFWDARGIVRGFMERLYEKSLAPFKWDVSRTESHLYLYVKNQDTLQALARDYMAQVGDSSQESSYQSFFKALESTYISDLIHEVRIKVKIKNVDGSLTFRELSEGEQQLLMVLGLMRFTKEEESLFLLDEPDTHLNPAWSVDYLNFIQGATETNIVGLRQNSQVLITTHNPMTLAGLKAPQVKIVHRKDDGLVYSASASQDPKGMGFAGILTSDIFGLQSTLDPETLGKLDRQRRLLIKNENELTSNEKAELNRLNQELEDIDATRFVRDPYYSLFVKTMKQYEIETGAFQSRTLSPEEMKERDRIAMDILEEIFDEEGGE